MIKYPRLRLTTRTDKGEVSLLGDYPDGLLGRKQARKDLEQEREAGDNEVSISREFKSGPPQELIRIPVERDDRMVKVDNGEKAQREELRRAELFLFAPEQVLSPPLTRLEQLAQVAGAEGRMSRANFTERHEKIEQLQQQIRDAKRARYEKEIMAQAREQLMRIVAPNHPQGEVNGSLERAISYDYRDDLATPEQALKKRDRAGRFM
ncbi:hypothetical protein [Luteimonas sp. SDU101]|uniref:hypothetical protein n=1 Tax=Luteimonas sp. SDU101 TaxID=3422593 RepID=UPI003EBAAA44